MSGVSVLLRLWEQSGRRLRERCHGLTDEEFFWEPCDGCWGVRRNPDVPGGWIMDYPDVAPDPPPVTTLGWRLLHITHGNWIYWEYAFGPARRTFLDLPIHGSADTAVADLAASQRPVAQALDSADDVALGRPVRTPEDQTWPASAVFRTLLNEQVHHGAEIGLLRDLYRSRSTLRRPPGS